MTPRIILAKYAPNLHRMEPRNIGVFLWANGRLHAKFAEDADAPFIRDPANFSRWRSFWLGLARTQEIPSKTGQPVKAASPTCVDALLSTQDGNFLLVDSGEVLATVKTRDAQSALDYLFLELVSAAEGKAHEQSTTGFKSKCEDLLKHSGLSSRQDFKRRYEISMPTYGHVRRLHFDYGFGNGVPVALLQRADLTKEGSVNNAGFLLHRAVDTAVLPKDRCIALIQRSAANSSASANENLQWLESISFVIDVDEPTAAKQIAENVPATGSH